MISPIRSLCFNDDKQTFTVVLPSQYRVFRCEPFGMIFSRECEDLSLGSVSTYNGYRFIALTGSPSPPNFNSKCVRIFDHQTGQIAFEQKFPDHVLSMKLGNGIIVVNMHKRIEIWNTEKSTILSKFEVGLNVHCPLAISPDSSTIMCSGPSENKIHICVNVKSDNLTKSALKVDTLAVSIITFSSNGALFATAAFSGSTISVWDSKTNKCVAMLERQASGDIVQTIDFSPDASYVVSCSKDGLVRVFDITKQSRGVIKPIAPICTAELASVTMPRLSWMTENTIGVTSLDGDFYKLTFSNDILEVESTTFLKRTE